MSCLIPFVQRCFRVIGPLAILLPALLVTGCVSSRKPTARFELPATNDGLPGAGPITRGEWFSRLWRERRQAFAQSVRRDQGALVFLGDSITHGWGDDLGGNFPGLKVANRGIGGDTSRGALTRLPDDVLALHPAGVVLLIGTNDIEQSAGPEIIAGNIRLILTALHQQSSAMPVVLCSVFPSSASKKRPADRIRRVNALLRALAGREPQVSYLDLWTHFANPTGDANPEEFPDLLHPNSVGYAKWAAAMRPLLRQLGFHAAKSIDPVPGEKTSLGAKAADSR
jgi:lysophospholipase L1-like esterase